MRKALYGVLTVLLLSVTVAQAQGPYSTPSIFTLDNNATGTTQYRLAKIVAGKLTQASTGDTAIPLFPILAGAGTTGTAAFVFSGEAECEFDTTVASGLSHGFVLASTTTAGKCHAQLTAPSSGTVIGLMVDDSTSTAAGVRSRYLVLNINYSPGTGTGTGTVTNIAMTVPTDILAVSPSSIAVSGTFAITKTTQTANTVLAGPTSGGAAAPTFRTLVAADVPAAPPGGSAGGDLAGTYPNPTVAKAATTFALQGETTPSTLTGTTNDYAGCTTATCRLTGGAADRDITGIAAPATSGTLLDVCNVGTTNALVLKHQNTGSSAANRLELGGGDVTIAPGLCEALRYDGNAATLRWRALVGTVPDYLKIRAMGGIVGDPGVNSPPLAADNDSPSIMTNDYERPLAIKTVACWADAAGLTVRVSLTGGSPTSVLTTDCLCGAAAWTACAVQTTPPVLQSFSGTGATCPGAPTTPCSADILVVSTTGTAKYAIVKAKAMLQ
jgi:hypothetical protein